MTGRSKGRGTLTYVSSTLMTLMDFRRWRYHSRVHYRAGMQFIPHHTHCYCYIWRAWSIITTLWSRY